ncbi:MAG: MBL fold metallo-hydrolase [Neisseriales bacterium]|nr:MAG: MBL fold metallo-hydrolase [Neisseriales bacterium]
MKLIFLGVSSALSIGYLKFHSNMLVETDSGKRILIDCGGDVRHAMFELGYTAKQIDAVFISHLHADHVGGLEWLGFSKFFMENIQVPLYIGPELKDRLWKNVLCGGMSTLEYTEANLETFFRPEKIEEDLSFTFDNYTFQLIKVPHSYSNNLLLPSYGLLIHGNKQKIFITTDTRFAPDELNSVYKDADIIFHDCETSEHLSNQHSHYNQLVTLSPEIKQKIWLYDYNDCQLPDAHTDGFLGFVTRGQQFEF